MSKRVLVCIAEGTEEIEATVPIDLLRRASSPEAVVVARVGGDAKDLSITASNKTKLTADVHLTAVKDQTFDAIVIPGGFGGATVCGGDPTLVQMLKAQKAAGRIYAAICASPALVFAPNGLLEGISKCTCYPLEDLRSKLPTLQHADEKVCVDGACVTSQGPGTAALFGLRLVELLFGADKMSEVGKATLFL